ncbi:lebercilin isoform X2 [Pleurodeles waltl]|uniref:lebercilin isoform X2 n=1 Tax=Pleurodeles waltl TaxID=8319 RepID=UPI0037098763
MSFFSLSSEHADNKSPDKYRLPSKSPSRRNVSSNIKKDSRRQLQKSKLKEESNLTMGERGRTKSRDRDHDRNSDTDKNSDSYYSDDYDNTTYGSERSPTPSSKARSPMLRRKAPKGMRSSTPLHNQGMRKVNSKQPLSKRGARWGFRSQSLNKDPPPKDIDLVTKRVLSARLLKINELRNELTELQIRLEEQQKENKALRRMQFRQEKALNKFEDTESEISQLISRHNNELRALRERLRKSLEQERTTERKLKETEEELYRTSSSLQKLKKLSEDRHLGEREALSQKLLLAEGRLEDRDRKVKDLEKNLELSQSSFQRQLLFERKKAREAQEENKSLRDELLRLGQKLKEKERELDAKNIYAFRLSKPSPKKDSDFTPRKKASNPGITSRSVQTSDSFLPSELPPPPPFILDNTEQKEREAQLQMEQEINEKRQREHAEHVKQQQQHLEKQREMEEKLKRDEQQQILEEKAQKLRDEWEKEEFDRRLKENNLLLEKIEREERSKTEAAAYETENEKENLDDKMEEERRKKELLLAKMNEIDKEKQNGFHSDVLTHTKAISQTQHLDKPPKHDLAEKKNKMYTFSEPTQNLYNGIPVQGKPEFTTKEEGQGRRTNKTTDHSADLAFGNYAPSFGKVSGRSGLAIQKSGVSEENVVNNVDLGFHKQKDKKSNLLEQLFGANAITATTLSKTDDQKTDNRKVGNGSGDLLPWDRVNKVNVKEGRLNFTEVRSVNPNRHLLQPAAGRPAVRAINSLDDEIEEVAL